MNHGPIAVGKPHILWACNVLHFDQTSSAVGFINNQFARRAMQSANTVIFPSESARREGGRWAKGNAAVLPHPFRSDIGRWNAPSDTKDLRIFVPSTANAHKNLDLLPAVADELASRGFACEFGVTAEQLPNHGSVSTVPRYEHGDMAAVASRYDVAFLPTLRESYSYPLLELAHMGMPVAASDIGPHRELASHAVLFDPNDAVAGAQAILEARESSARDGSERFLSPDQYAKMVWSKVDESLEDR